MRYAEFIPPEFIAAIDNKDVLEGSLAVCDYFNTHITRNYPWVPIALTRLDWTKIPNATQLEATTSTAQELEDFIQTTTAGDFTQIALIQSTKLPSFIMSVKYMVGNFDLITVMLPYTGYFVAVHETTRAFVYHLDVFLEWKADSGMWLSGMKSVEDGRMEYDLTLI